MIEELTNINIDTGFEETIQWTFTPGKLDVKAIEQMFGKLKTAFKKCAPSTTSTVPEKMPLLKHLIEGPGAVRDVTVCEDGSIIAALDGIDSLYMYSGNGEHTGTICPNTNPCGVNELPDGNIAISCPADEAIRVYSRSGTHVNTMTEGQGSTSGIALSPRSYGPTLSRPGRSRVKVMGTIASQLKALSQNTPQSSIIL